MHLRPLSLFPCLLSLALAALPPPALAATASLRQVQLLQQGAEPALELRFSSPVAVRSFRLQHPNRLVVDMEATRLALRSPLPHARAPLTAVRLAARDRHALRLVVEFATGVSADVQPLTAATSGERLLRIDIRAGAPVGSAGSAGSAVATAPVAVTRVVTVAHAPARGTHDIVIAIDAGHGGEDPGASGRDGTQEKRITLAIARTLAERVNAMPGMRAILTRDSDRFVPLRERTARARNARADMFISIHADAVRDRDVEGASVYTLSGRGASSEAARFLADRENAADLKGVSLKGQSDALASVLVDLSQSAAMGSSTEAAAIVLNALDSVGAVRKPEVQHAGFVVLKSPDMPSMLIETAYISNPDEERKLRSDSYQQRLANAIATGVGNYFHDHPPDGTRDASNDRNAENLALARANP
jgi:N-acetylmuramoyl-L-alanine amidase